MQLSPFCSLSLHHVCSYFLYHQHHHKSMLYCLSVPVPSLYPLSTLTFFCSPFTLLAQTISVIWYRSLSPPLNIYIFFDLEFCTPYTSDFFLTYMVATSQSSLLELHLPNLEMLLDPLLLDDPIHSNGPQHMLCADDPQISISRMNHSSELSYFVLGCLMGILIFANLKLDPWFTCLPLAKHVFPLEILITVVTAIKHLMSKIWCHNFSSNTSNDFDRTGFE